MQPDCPACLYSLTPLLRTQALRNPVNQKFVLISESGIPLYPPQVLYLQLLLETKSRIMACKSDEV